MRRGSGSGRYKVLQIILFIVCICTITGIWTLSEVQQRKKNAEAIASSTFTESNDEPGASGTNAGTSIQLGGQTFRYTHQINNFLLAGIDDSKVPEGGCGMADYLLLLSLDRTSGTFSFVEINRDAMTDSAYSEDDEQICLSSWNEDSKQEGVRQLAEAVSDYLGGLRINGYFAMNLSDIRQLNHVIGGVSLTFSEDLTAIDPSFEKGSTVVLSDDQAYQYLTWEDPEEAGTSRHMDRQTAYLKAFLNESFSRIEEDGSYYSRVLSSMRNFGTTNMTSGTFTLIGASLASYSVNPPLQFEGTYRGRNELADGKSHSRFYAEPESVVEVMKAVLSLQQDEASSETATE